MDGAIGTSCYVVDAQTGQDDRAMARCDLGTRILRTFLAHTTMWRAHRTRDADRPTKALNAHVDERSSNRRKARI